MTRNDFFFIEVNCGSAGGFAHEISHLVFKCKNKVESNSGVLTSHILKKFYGYNPSIVKYFKIEKITDYDKLIGYLYLAEEDELVAKLAGFYVALKLDDKGLNETGDFVNGVCDLYSEMKIFKINSLEIEKEEKAKGILSRFLKSRIPLNSEIFKSLITNINTQGENFENKYKILFES